MTIPKRIGAVVLSLAAIVLMGRFPLAAQEPSKEKTTPPPAQKKQTHRVPDYFGKIALTPDQKNNIYKVVDKRQEKIEALEKQIATERAEMLHECEALLNETQKKLLDNLRKAASEPRPKLIESAKPVESTKGSD
jgi:Spy/CpxP family protein refolding chaperone